ncbi:MAG: ubiquitin-conjugating enzyme E2 [Thermoplasmata archaeon]
MPRLPPDILQKRLRTELKMCREELPRYTFDVSDETFSSFPVTIRVTMRGVPGPVWRNGRVTTSSTHRFTMKVTDEYPYKKPIIIWETDIFHPNIMTPEDGGFVCTKLLDEWSFGANLLLFIQALETLLSNPNCDNAYISDSCVRAAKHFAKNPYRPPAIIKEKSVLHKPRIVSASKAQEKK